MLNRRAILAMGTSGSHSTHGDTVIQDSEEGLPHNDKYHGSRIRVGRFLVSSRRLIIAVILLIIVILMLILNGMRVVEQDEKTPVNYQIQRSKAGPSTQRSQLQPEGGRYDGTFCAEMGYDPKAKANGMNSRAWCVTGPVCISHKNARLIYFDMSTSEKNEVRCEFQVALNGTRDTNGGLVSGTYAECYKLYEKRVMKAAPKTERKPRSWPQDHSVEIRWVDGTRGSTSKEPYVPAVILPDYEYSSNIFHAARGIMYGLHTAWNIELLEYLVETWRFEIGGTSNFTESSSLRSKIGVNSAEDVEEEDYDQLRKHQKKQQIRLFWALLKEASSWARELFHIIRPELEQAGFQVSKGKSSNDVESHTKYSCFRQALVLGTEGQFDALVFLNDTELPLPGQPPVISREALRFKAVVYQRLDLDGPFEYSLIEKPNANNNGQDINTIPSQDDELLSTQLAQQFWKHNTITAQSSSIHMKHRGMSYRLWVKPPPVSVLYVLRKNNSERSFDSTSEKRFENLLKQLCKYKNIPLTIQRFEELGFKSQVSLVHDFGLIVGMHGANLVNSIFMAPFSGMVEIFPFRYVRYYYYAGSNSGLRYLFWQVTNGQVLRCDDRVNQQEVDRYVGDMIALQAERMGELPYDLEGESVDIGSWVDHHKQHLASFYGFESLSVNHPNRLLFLNPDPFPVTAPWALATSMQCRLQYRSVPLSLSSFDLDNLMHRIYDQLVYLESLQSPV